MSKLSESWLLCVWQAAMLLMFTLVVKVSSSRVPGSRVSPICSWIWKCSSQCSSQSLSLMSLHLSIHSMMVTLQCAQHLNPANKITSLQRPWKVLLSSCKRCVKTSRGRQCVEFSLRPQNDLKKRRAGTLTGRSGDVGLLWWRPGNVARKFCFHKNFPGTLSESFVSNRIVCLCSVNVV